MKEKIDDEEIIDDNDNNEILNQYNMGIAYNNINIEQNISNDNYPSIDSLLGEKDENKLKSINSLLQENSYFEDYDVSNIIDEEDTMEKDSEAPKILYNAKDYIFTFFLLMSSSVNCSILYYPYILLGFILTFFLYSYSQNVKKFKTICELCTIIYSALLLIFKIVLIILTKNDNERVKNNENVFINLGIKLLKDKESTTYLITTFISECVLVIISVIALIISYSLSDFDFNDISKNKLTRKEMFKLFFKHLLINYFMFLFLAMFNTSIITFIYLFIINVLLIFIARHSSIRIITFFFKIFAILIFIIIILQISLMNILNIYHFAEILEEYQENKKNYSVFTQIGINYMFDKDDFTLWLSYLFTVISLLSLSFSHNNITFNRIYLMNTKSKSNQDDLNENESVNCFIKLLREIKMYFTSPSFILHICRLLAIGYLYFRQDFYAIIIFIWLLFSFLFLRVESNKVLTYIVILDILLSLFCFHIANINGLFENQDQQIFSLFDVYHLNLVKFDDIDIIWYYIYYFSLNLFYCFIILFIYFLYESDEQKKIIEKKTIAEKQPKEELAPKKDLNENLLEEKGNIIIEKNEDNSEDNKESNENETGEIRLTDQIISNEEEKEKEKEVTNSTNEINNELLKKKLTLQNIIKKVFYSHIDKISLVVMYFIAVRSVNVIHVILVFIFMIQLLFPKLIEYISKFLMIIIQLLYLSEFVMDILKHYYLEKFNEFSDLIKVFMLYNETKEKTAVEIFLYGIVYCFYIQYKLYNNDFYKETVLDEDINLKNYIIYKFSSYPNVKQILLFIGGIIIEIYIWILITLFIFFDSYFEISILFEVKLVLFFIIVFQFLKSIQKSEEKNISLCLNWLFLIYCSFNTLLVYGYQILCLKYFDGNQSSNLANIGFTHYEEDELYYKFLPHFVCNFISILFIWEMKRILLQSNKIDIDNKIQPQTKILIKEDDNDLNNNIDKENNKDDEDKKDVVEGEELLGLTPSEQYEKNKKEMQVLNALYYLYNIFLIFAKFYWLFLFLSICIIFTKFDLSILLLLYLLIFSITFIRMFYQIITKLTNFINHKSFFISRLLRYNLIEQNRHILQNKYYRSLAFKYLLSLSFFSYLLFYSYGVFYLFQHGCEEQKGCIIAEENEIIFECWAYLFGFYINMSKNTENTEKTENTVFIDAWYHLFFAILISFDVYVQKMENYFNKKAEENRKRYKFLANENIKIKPLTFGEDNILMNIGYGIKKIEEEQENENSTNMLIRGSGKEMKEKDDENINTSTSRLRSSKIAKEKTIEIEKRSEGLQFNIETKTMQEEEIIGKKLIEDFLKIFEKATSKKIKLSNQNIKYIVIKVLKQIFEEIIIFLLICTSISKMNVWSFIYMIISLLYIIRDKTMMRYYILYCFIIFSIFIQTAIFISNIQKNTDPNPDVDLLEEIENQFKIPWYRNRLDLDDIKGYFFGFGVSHSQINLIWWEFIEIIIIYIYLDYFSYSIYQEANTIGRAKNKTNKINYYNLYLNQETKEASLKLTEEEYNKHKICMNYNFGIDILPYEQFMHYMKEGVFQSNSDQNQNQNQLPSIEEKPEEENNEKISIKDENIITTEKSENKNIIENKDIVIKLDKLDEEKDKIESPLIKKALSQTKKIATTTNLMEKSKEISKSSGKWHAFFKDFIYLSLHNVILIIIIIISMMVSGFISIFYITYSLYFLITSTSIYLGNKYYYPRAIKTILRISILLDITIQILYQTPYINSDIDNQNNSFFKILKFIGLNKILTFQKNEQSGYEVILDHDQLLLVLAKAFTYLFMSFQILVYSSQSFQEYYLSYIITKNNILRRISLMNVFKFNNNRIEAMNRSINLRQDMSKSMSALRNKLEQWNANLMMTKSDNNNNRNYYIVTQDQQQENIDNKQEQEKQEEKEDNKEIKKDDEDNNINNIGFNFIENLQSIKENVEKEDDKEDNKEKKEEEIKEDDQEKKPMNLFGKINLIRKKKKEEEEKKEGEDKMEKEKKKGGILKKTGGFFSNIGLPIEPIKKKISEEEEEEEIEYLPEKEVYKRIKDWILGGFLIKLQIKLYEYASNYTSIDQNEKDIYERDTIQGKTKITSFIENMVDMQLNTIDLSCFTSLEMKEVKSYFDGTWEKKLAEIRKKKEKTKQIQNTTNKIIKANKMAKMLLTMKKENVENGENMDEDKEKEEVTQRERLDTFKEKNLGVLKEVKNQQKKEKKKVIDLEQPKFQKLEKFVTSKLFIKYLSKSYIIKSIINNIISFFLNNFHWLCYLMMIINHMFSSSLITLFYPLSIFCYALLEYPRPPKGYWTLCLIYTLVLLGAKFVIHLEVFKESETFKDIITYFYNYKIGLKLYDTNFSGAFFKYILSDALVLIFLLINDYLLVSRGIWNKREQEIENIYQAMKRIAETKDIEINDIVEIKNFNNRYLEKIKSEKRTLLNDTDQKNVSVRNTDRKIKGMSLKSSIKSKGMDEKKKVKKKKKAEEDRKTIDKKKEEDKYNESKRKYFQKLIPKIRNEKPGNDYYASYTISMLLLITFILIFYTTMVQDKTFGAVELDTKQFSGAMVIVLVIHVGILIYDRVLYISQNRNNIKYDYILYDKETKEPLSEKKFNDIKSDISSEYPNMKRDTFIIPPEYAEKLKEKYTITYIQNEELNLPLLQKYILHMVIVISAHLFIFFYCPMTGNMNMFNQVYCPDESSIEDEDNQQCNDFLKNNALIIFYLIYIIYFISSGLQVKYGFYDMKRKSMLKSGKSSINGVIYNSFKAIPFLYEIKLAIDWTFTKTCLDLFQWNKFESVYDIVYCTYCSMNAKNQQLVGQKIGKLLKIFMGGALSFGLVFILIAPLMLFSSLNPTNKLNNLTGATLKVDLSFVYKNKAVKNYTLFENSKPQSIESIFREGCDDWEIYNYSVSPKTKNFPPDQIQTVQFFDESDKNWDLARPHIENLRNLILNRKNISDLEYIGLVIDYNFDRPLPAESMTISKRYSTTIYYYNNNTDEENEKLDTLGNALSSCYNVSIVYQNIYSPPIRLSANVKPKRLTDEKYFPNLDVMIGFVGCRNETESEGEEKIDKASYLESYFTFQKVMKDEDNNKTNIEGIKFHVFSDQVSTTTSGKNILTFYVSFVLLLGNYVRNFFAGQPEKIMLTEMPHSEEIINLCEGIQVSRNSFDFEQEEKLYYILIELMRSPDYLRSLTQSSTEQFKQRQQLTRANKTSEKS